MAKSKRLIAILLTLAMLISVVSVATINVGATIDAIGNYTFTEDFSDSDRFAEMWNDEVISGEFTGPSTPSSLSEGMLKSAYNTTTNGLVITTLKDSYWNSSSLISSVSFDYTVPNDLYSWNSSKPILYYDSESKLAVGVEFSANKYVTDSETGANISRSFTMRTYRANNVQINDDGTAFVYPHSPTHATYNGVGSTSNSTFTIAVDESGEAYLPKLHFDVKYEYIPSITASKDTLNSSAYNALRTGTKESILKITAVITNTENTSQTSTRVFYIAREESAPYNGFKMGFLGNTTSEHYSYIDSITIQYEANRTDDEYVDLFLSRNEEILEVSAEDISEEHIPLVDAALSDYDSLSDNAKLAVSEQKALLDTLSEVVEGKIKENFKTNHAAILEKTTAQIKVTDRDAIFTALEEYNAMSEFSKECCLEEKAILDELLSAFYLKNSKFNVEDFEYSTYTDYYWTTEKISGTNDAPATDWSIVDGKLKGSYNSSTADYIGVTTIKDELWSEENLITKLSFDYYVGGTNYSNVEPVFYYDPESKLTVAWESAKNTTTGVYTSRRDYFNDVITNDKDAYDESMVYPNIDLYSTFNGIGTTSNNNYWTESDQGALPEYLHFDVTYNYCPSIIGTYTNGVSVSLLQIIISISANGEKIENRTYNITKKENDTFNGFKFGVVTGSVASDILFDNFVVECELNSDDIEEIADEYIAKHIGILSLKYDEVKAEHKTVVETALAEYETLRDQVREALIGEKTILETQLRIINGDFEYDASDIASVRKAWNTLKASSSDSEREYLSGLNSILLGILNDYAKNSSATVKPKVKVACVGDSLTNFTKYAEQYRYPAVLQGILGDGYIVEDHGLGGGDVDDMLSTTYTNHIKEFQPDVILLNLGLNDSFSEAEQAEKYYQLIEFYQSLESSPTILLTTSIWSYARKVSNSDFIRSVADNLDLPFIDMNIITKAAIDETYNNYLSKNDYSDNEFLSEYFENYDINAEVNFANYCTSNNITDEAVKKALFATLYDWFYYSVNSEGVISFEDGPLHFGKEGYKFMAREFKRFFDYSYLDLVTNSDGLINLNCYINEWDASYDADVDALIGAVSTLGIANNTEVADLVAVYNSLNDVQKLRFEKNFKESYDKLMMASACLASAPIVEAAINEYIESYGAFLAKDIYTAEDLATYIAALADFENQSEVVEYYLAEQKATLDVACEQIATALADIYISTGVTPENPSGVEYKALLIAWKTINGYNREEFATVLEARKTIAASITAENEAPNDDKIRVLCVGDSLTWGNYSSGHYIGSYPTVLQGLLGDKYHIKNIGINGARIWDINLDKEGKNPMVFLSDEYKAITEQYQPNIVIIMLGTNNSGSAEESNIKGGAMYNYMLEHIDYYRSLESSPTVIMATSPAATNKIINGVDSLRYIRMMQRNIAADENLAFVDIEKLTSAWEPYSEATAETSYFKPDNLHFGDAGYAAIAQEFADYIGELNCEFSTASIDAMDYSAPNFVKKYESLAEAGVTSETVDAYTTMVNEYENLLPKSKEAVTEFRNSISFAETNSSVLENTTTEDGAQVLEIFNDYNNMKDILEEIEPETAEKIETAITNAGLRPQVLGKTLSVSTSPIMGTVAAKPENDNYIAMGMVFTSYNSMTEQGIRTLTKETPKALHTEREYSEGDVKDETLIFGLKGIMDVADKWGYYIASRSYVVYELEDGTRVTIYNEATHTNPDDATEIDSSAAVRSINSLIKSMATTLYSAGSNDEVNTIEGVNEYEGKTLKEFCDTHDSAILETGVKTMELLIAYKEVFEKIAQ